MEKVCRLPLVAQDPSRTLLFGIYCMTRLSKTPVFISRKELSRDAVLDLTSLDTIMLSTSNQPVGS